MTLVVYSSHMPCSVGELFDLHADAANLPAISPPFPPVRLLSEAKHSAAGDRQFIRFGWGRLGLTWEALITRVEAPRLLEDIQVSGPFRSWRHQHRFAAAADGSALTDVVAFRFFPTAVGEFVEFYTLRPCLLAMFAMRHRKTRGLVAHDKS